MARIEVYDRGQGVIVEVTFLDADGAPSDPSPAGASILIRHESDAVTALPLDDEAVSNPSVGVYATEVVADQAGKWHYRGESTEGLVCAAESYFTVKPSAFD